MTDEPLLMATNGAIEGIWYCPPNDGRMEALLIEIVGGGKRYRRVWLNQDMVGMDEETWFKPDDAVLIAGESD